MESGEDTKVESVMCERFKMQEAEDRTSDISSLQARRRFMITDILNSSLERREGKVEGREGWGEVREGLDMRLLFPRLPLNLHQGKQEPETESDNEAEEDPDNDDEKGNFTLCSCSVLSVCFQNLMSFSIFINSGQKEMFS